MIVNADFSRVAIVSPSDYEWVASPQRGVDRVLLERHGGEQARATSIVRYAPESHFPSHQHPGGEEIFVLMGIFSDEYEDYPAGWYLRNPPGSSHRPSSREGATLFVKLRQMAPDDTHHVRIDTRDPASWQSREGRDVCPLFSSDYETVRLVRLPANERLLTGQANSVELLVLSGQVVHKGQSYECGTWIRFPEGVHEQLAAGANGTMVYFKTGQLPAISKCRPFTATHRTESRA